MLSEWLARWVSGRLEPKTGRFSATLPRHEGPPAGVPAPAVRRWVNRRQLAVIDYLKEENRILREQMQGRLLRFTDDQRRRLAVRGKALGRRMLRDVTSLLTPDTILRWYRKLIAAKYDGSSQRGSGRPPTALSVQKLVVRFARDNPGWGYTRLRGALRNLGHEIDRTTIQRILAEHSLPPAPERSKRMPWRTFIRAHLGALAAMDFFNVEVLSLTGLVRYSVLFVIDLQTRRVQIAGIASQVHGAWMKQVARNLTDDVDGFLRGMRYLIHDRDPLFAREFRDVLRAAGVKSIRLPAHSPDLNAYAERFVLSIKSECLNKLVLLGQRHLRRAGGEFVEHYHLERNHQGLDNRLITALPAPPNDQARVARRERLGGLLNYYYRRAA
jgi:putative transposase